MKRIALTFCLLLFALVSTTPTASAATSADGVWTDVDEAAIEAPGERLVVPAIYRTLELDGWALGEILDRAPHEDAAAVADSPAVLSLPLPDGGFGRFRVVEAPIMAPELAADFPAIHTFRGQGIDDPHASVRFDRTPQGFHAAVLSPSGNFYVDPYRRGDADHYLAYFTRDARNPAASEFACATAGSFIEAAAAAGSNNALASGDELRSYRLAVAATGEYTAFHGGTVPAGMAAIVTAMNRVNGIYEREVAIRMILVANNDLVVYTDGATDPYSNGNGVAMLGQNQANLDAVIGDANYDIGHVFSTGGGGVASLRVPCVSGVKARGVTGLSAPTGDVFWVDYVSHEMGHQWGGNHSFNGNAGSCSGGNRNGQTAYEPGSGTTIMAYAGICGDQDVQDNSDDYFHGVSFGEITSYSTGGNGNNCAVVAATGNNAPAVDPADSFTIPVDTPFGVCGTATDPDDDPLTYSWEQFDRGPAGHPDTPTEDAPIFRSFTSVTSPCRTFPRLEDLAGNVHTLGEILPTYARDLHFRLTARDNRSGGGGVGFDQSAVISVTAAAGPFAVTAPNTAVVWSVNVGETVTWDVAGTDLAPVGCAAVDVELSEDGGFTYPRLLAAATANDGSEIVTVPSDVTATTSARVRVRCSDNVFFDISDVDFEIETTGMIFADGFESGDTSSWFSTTTPLVALPGRSLRAKGAQLGDESGDVSVWSAAMP